MRPTLLHPTAILLTSILCSLLLHWATFTNLVLVWPALKETPKPMIVFLGSILQSSNMADQTSDRTSTTVPLHNLTKINNPSALYTGSLEKPWQERPGNPQYKKTLKTFQNDDEEASKATTPLAVNDVEIELTIEPYKPLRLKDSD